MRPENLIRINSFLRMFEPYAGQKLGLEFPMADNRIARRNKLRETLAELRNAALSELENLGYQVRGKTPGEVRQLLKRHPSKQKSKAQVD